ncbi:MAG: hypothetical protein BGO98_38050 [Myxococcales bacterium 68-20]|nr:MAG: hypothetical protein BGO98_38050 [Myxococcales bacterium 68-20]
MGHKARRRESLFLASLDLEATMSLDVTVSETFGAGIIQAPAKLEAPTIARATRGRCAGRRPRL